MIKTPTVLCTVGAFLSDLQPVRSVAVHLQRQAEECPQGSHHVGRVLSARRLKGGVHGQLGQTDVRHVQRYLGIGDAAQGGTARHLAELYGQMEEASAELVYRCRKHRRNRELFADPIRQICYLTSVFLEGCADPKAISDQNRINAFESFYTDQLKHRATLLKRIAGENAESFLELNMDYDLATVEKMELEAKKNRRKNEREAAARRKQEKAAQREINLNK